MSSPYSIFSGKISSPNDRNVLKTLNNEAKSKVINFDVAVTDDYVSRDGERHIQYLPCVAWNESAEKVAKYAKTGTEITIRAYLKTRNVTLTSKDGKTEKTVTQYDYLIDAFDVAPNQTNRQTETVEAENSEEAVFTE